MAEPVHTDSKHDEIVLRDIFRPVVGYGRLIWRATLVAGLAAVLLAAAYFFVQPTTRTASLQFRPTFIGADDDKYPNGLPFSPMDIVNPSVVSQVYARNDISRFCSLERFHGSLVVQETSPELELLTQQFEARFADTRLTSIDRQRLQEEYNSRRATVQSQYHLLFIQPQGCAVLPRPVVFKVLAETVEIWANDAQNKRGVIRVLVPVLTPAIFDQADAGIENVLIRADLLRTAVSRVVSNIASVEKLPGSELVRGSDKQVSFAEVRAELEDLIQARLNPVITLAGRSLGAEATRWAQQALEAAEIRHQAAKNRAEAYRHALREYSGVSSTPPQAPGAPGDRTQTSSDVQTLTPQIDSTFIDRIVALSESNTKFRQEITQQAITASVETVEREAVVGQYQQLLKWLGQNGALTDGGESVAQALTRFTAQAREATRRFNQIYDEFSALSLRNGSTVYRIEQPAHAEVIRAFTLRSIALILLAVLIAVPIILTLAILLRYHLRRFVAGMR